MPAIAPPRDVHLGGPPGEPVRSSPLTKVVTFLQTAAQRLHPGVRRDGPDRPRCHLATLIALVGLGRRAVRASPRGTLDRGVAAGFLGCVVAFVAVGASANVTSNVVSLWSLFTFAAAASAVVLRKQAQASTMETSQVS